MKYIGLDLLKLTMYFFAPINPSSFGKKTFREGVYQVKYKVK